MRELHLANKEGRDSTVLYVSMTYKPPHRTVGPDGADVTFRRYLANPDGFDHTALVAAHGEDYGQALVDGDPEVDVEQIGRAIGSTDDVFLTSEGKVLHAPPRIVEILIGPDGVEKERRNPVNEEGNVLVENALRHTKMRLKRDKVVRRFVFGRTIQLRHSDGLTYDFLYAMAKDLDAADECVLIGGGKKGRDALRFQNNGKPYRAFLEGRVDGQRYQLLLHLSEMELKRPEGVA